MGGTRRQASMGASLLAALMAGAIMSAVPSHALADGDEKPDIPAIEEIISEPDGEEGPSAVASVGEPVPCKVVVRLPQGVEEEPSYGCSVTATVPRGLRVASTPRLCLVGTDPLTGRHVTLPVNSQALGCPVTVIEMPDGTTEVSASFDAIRLLSWGGVMLESVELRYSVAISDPTPTTGLSGAYPIRATMTYPSPDGDGTETQALPVTASVVTWELAVHKHPRGKERAGLAGATFVLHRKPDGAYLAKGGGWVAERDDAREVTTDTRGDISLLGIGDGEYELIEVTSPSGYLPLEDPIPVSISSDIAALPASLTVSVAGPSASLREPLNPENGEIGVLVANEPDGTAHHEGGEGHNPDDDGQEPGETGDQGDDQGGTAGENQRGDDAGNGTGDEGEDDRDGTAVAGTEGDGHDGGRRTSLPGILGTIPQLGDDVKALIAILVAGVAGVAISLRRRPSSRR